MKMTKIKTKDEAIKKAIEWQEWQSNQNLFLSEVCDWVDYFEQLAKRFDLKEEFKENGII